MIEQALIAYLREQPAVRELVGDRVVMLVAAENIKRPLIVLYRTSTRRVSHKVGVTGDVRAEFELHCVAEDPFILNDVGLSVERALSRMPGDPGEVSVDLGTNVPIVRFSQFVVTNQRDAFADDAKLYVRIISGYLWYTEAI